MKKNTQNEKINPAQMRRFFDILIKVVIAISTCFTATQI